MVGAPALGPILGGLLVDHGLWRWIFFINVPVGILGIVLAAALLRPVQQPPAAPANPLSIVGAILGFGSLLYGCTIAARMGWGSLDVIATVAFGIIVLVIFAVVELRVAKEPLVDLRLYRNPVFRNASLVGYVAVVALFGAEFLMPLYLQGLRGRSGLETGLILMPLAFAAALMNPITGLIYDKIGPRVLVLAGTTALAGNSWQFARLGRDTPLNTILLLLALRGVAISLVMQPTMTTALGAVPHSSMPRGSSLVNSTRFVAQALGVAILAAVFSASLSPEVRALQRQEGVSSAGVSCSRLPSTQQ